VPGTAAGLTDLGPGDSDPLELRRVVEHFLQQLAVAGLDQRSVGKRGSRFGGALREAVANLLELAEVEHPRGSGRRPDPVGHLGAPEGLAEEGSKLRLQARDLTPQLQARLALVDPDSEPGEILLLQQSGHQGKL
jgi:hypothetical protein